MARKRITVRKSVLRTDSSREFSLRAAILGRLSHALRLFGNDDDDDEDRFSLVTLRKSPSPENDFSKNRKLLRGPGPLRGLWHLPPDLRISSLFPGTCIVRLSCRATARLRFPELLSPPLASYLLPSNLRYRFPPGYFRRPPQRVADLPAHFPVTRFVKISRHSGRKSDFRPHAQDGTSETDVRLRLALTNIGVHIYLGF